MGNTPQNNPEKKVTKIVLVDAFTMNVQYVHNRDVALPTCFLLNYASNKRYQQIGFLIRFARNYVFSLISSQWNIK